MVEDTVIDPNAARAFAKKFNIPITILEHEGHSLGNSPDTPELVANLAILFYNTKKKT